MKFAIVILLVAYCIVPSKAENLTVGNSVGATVAYLENVKLSGVPFTHRVKNVFYSDASNRNIRAISARDLNDSKGAASVTAGGVGFSFANVRVKSERGEAINYQIIIYV